MSGLDPELFGGGGGDGDEDDGPEAPSEPMRILLSIGGGASLRIVKNQSPLFNQQRVGPGFIDGFGAVVFGTSSQWRHGLGVGASLNLSGDGGESQGTGVDPAHQIVLAPAYLGYYRLDEDFVFTAKASALFAFTFSGATQMAPGGELAFGLAFLLTSGLGIYGEIGGSVFVGSPEAPGESNTIHPLVTAEVGILIDYEVLP